MRIRHHAMGKFYSIRCPQGTRVVRNSAFRASGKPGPCDGIVVWFEGREIPIPADPPELLPLLAESGRCGLSLAREPEPEAGMVGVACPGCGEHDVAWLQLLDGTEAVHCDRCGDDFPLPLVSISPAKSTSRTAD